jgi:hypothetical protein
VDLLVRLDVLHPWIVLDPLKRRRGEAGGETLKGVLVDKAYPTLVALGHLGGDGSGVAYIRLEHDDHLLEAGSRRGIGGLLWTALQGGQKEPVTIALLGGGRLDEGARSHQQHGQEPGEEPGQRWTVHGSLLW